MPYSGPASSYGTIGKAEAAYFAMVNDQGGINGRKINFISRDDGYSPPKTVEMARQLVEQDRVLLLLNPLGSATNTAIRDYMNENKVPQIFISSGAAKFNDPKHYPWTMGFQPGYALEGSVYGRYILENLPDAKVAVLYQNDDFGKDHLIGLQQGLGAKAGKMILATQSYETTDATIDSQIASLRASGANVLFTAALSKFAAQAIRKVYDVGWNPTKFLINSAASIAATMKPAGLEKGIGVITAGWLPDQTDPEVQNTPAYKEWLTWMNKYYPSGNIADGYQFIWVRNFSGICRCAQKVWRRSHPRKRDEAGSQHPWPQAADTNGGNTRPRHHHLDERRRLCTGEADEVIEVWWHELGLFRRVDLCTD